MDLPLCICGIFFLYDRRNAGFAAENSAVAGGLFQSGSDDCHRIFLCLVQLQGVGNGFAVHKRGITAEHQCIAVGEFLHEFFCLHHCMTGAQLFRLQSRPIAAAQIQFHVLCLIAGHHADAAQACTLACTDHPAQHRHIQYLQHRLWDRSLHTFAVSAGKNNNLIHVLCPPVIPRSGNFRSKVILHHCMDWVLLRTAVRKSPFLHYDKILKGLQVFFQKKFVYCDFCITCHKNGRNFFLKSV